MISVIVGLGQIGRAVKELISTDKVYIVDKKYASPILGSDESIDIMHVCIPYNEDFVSIVGDYIDFYKPEHVIIYSTVPIGTTESIWPSAAHSPVEGRHPDLAESIKTMQRWIGCMDEMEIGFFDEYFAVLGLKTVTLDSANYTEALKLLSTSEFGVNLIFADYKAMIAEQLGMDYQYMLDWNDEYNRLYKKVDKTGRFQKYVINPPNGHIGGHCVVPNAEILNKQYPNDMLDKIVGMGKKQ